MNGWAWLWLSERWWQHGIPFWESPWTTETETYG